jgi:hypothetical protein
MNSDSATLELRDAVLPDRLLPGHDLAWWWLVAVVFLLITALLVLMLVFRAKAKPPHPSELREAAFHDALAALTASSPADARAAAVTASLAVRKYLSIAAADPALFETHEEFLTRHDALMPLKPEARDAAESGFAKLASMKYAPHPTDASAAKVMAESRTLLETLHHGFTT